MKKDLVMADSREGRLFCQTLLPENAKMRLVGGEGKEFLVGEKNYPFDPKYVKIAEAKALKSGRGPYWGEWRLEVEPLQANADDRFLHVLTAASVERKKPVPAKYVSDEKRDGVTLKVDGQKITFWFNRTGKVGGSVEYDSVNRSLTDKVQPQSGFEYK